MDDAEDDDSDIDDGLATSLGVLKVDSDKGKSMYIGQEHWHLILADISEVKTYFNNHKKELEKGYETEMRRRVWATVRMSDIFMSQHVALPAMIHDQDCDTELPSNVFDEDFGPETEVMPPPRPPTEPTPIAYALAKGRLGLELGNIIQVTGRVGRQVHYEEILRFDARLQGIMEELPPHLKMTPLEGSQDPVSLLMARFSIDILYQKILCVLHRKYLTRARTNSRYAHSRRTAIEASLVTLQHLATLHRETQPNGRLRSVKWYISSTATKDFLLPAMMVVMDLHVDKRETGKRRESDGDFFWTPEQRMNMIGNLELTRDVWKGLADTSIEAFKASKVLEIMLEKIRSPEPSEPIPESTGPFAEADTSQDMHPEHSAAVTLGMLSGGMTPNTAAVLASMQQADSQTTFGDVDFGMSGGTGMTPNFPQDIDMNVPQSPFSMFGNLEAGGDLMANFDWNAFESYTQSANWGTENGFGFLAPQPPDQAPNSQAQQPNNGNKGYTYPNPNASGL
ncbi:hypothetical protein ACHAP9_003356 [Verticillium nonalfalfae]